MFLKSEGFLLTVKLVQSNVRNNCLKIKCVSHLVKLLIFNYILIDIPNIDGLWSAWSVFWKYSTHKLLWWIAFALMYPFVLALPCVDANYGNAVWIVSTQVSVVDSKKLKFKYQIQIWILIARSTLQDRARFSLQMHSEGLIFRKLFI